MKTIQKWIQTIQQLKKNMENGENHWKIGEYIGTIEGTIEQLKKTTERKSENNGKLKNTMEQSMKIMENQWKPWEKR